MEYIKACFEDTVLTDGYMSFFDNRIQAVCKMNVNNYEIEIMEKFKGEKEFYGRKIFCLHNRYYIVEGNSTNVLIYKGGASRDDSKFHLVTLGTSCNSIVNEIYRYKDYIYFFPLFLDEKIICFDMNREEYFGYFFDKQYLHKMTGKQKIQKGFICLYENEIWIPIFRTRFYMKYNLMDGKSEIYQAKDRNAMLTGICYDGKDIWMMLENGSVVCEGKKEISIQEKQSYARLYNTRKFIIKSPRDTNRLILICKDNYEAKVIELPIADTKELDDQSLSITGCCETDIYIFLFRHGVEDLWMLNKETLEIESIKLQCKNYAYHYFESASNEYEDVGLKYFMAFLIEDKKNVFYPKDGKNTKGKKIWTYVKK